MRCPRANDRAAGFSLIEALVALTIVGLTSVAALGALGTELATAGRAQRLGTAAILAEGRLEAIRLLPEGDLRFLPDSLESGRFDPPFRAFRWMASSKPVFGESRLFDIAVRVEWEGGAFRLVGRLYQPERLVSADDVW